MTELKLVAFVVVVYELEKVRIAALLDDTGDTRTLSHIINVEKVCP